MVVFWSYLGLRTASVASGAKDPKTKPDPKPLNLTDLSTGKPLSDQLRSAKLLVYVVSSSRAVQKKPSQQKHHTFTLLLLIKE